MINIKTDSIAIKDNSTGKYKKFIAIKGDKGDKGDAGPGVPTGGTKGQALIKNSDSDYDMTWVDSGKVDDVQVDGISIVKNKIANIDSTSFGKVDDVKVNNISVVTNKVANITIDQLYDSTSANAQSGVAVASAIQNAITKVINADY